MLCAPRRHVLSETTRGNCIRVGPPSEARGMKSGEPARRGVSIFQENQPAATTGAGAPRRRWDRLPRREASPRRLRSSRRAGRRGGGCSRPSPWCRPSPRHAGASSSTPRSSSPRPRGEGCSCPAESTHPGGRSEKPWGGGERRSSSPRMTERPRRARLGGGVRVRSGGQQRPDAVRGAGGRGRAERRRSGGGRRIGVRPSFQKSGHAFRTVVGRGQVERGPADLQVRAWRLRFQSGGRGAGEGYEETGVHRRAVSRRPAAVDEGTGGEERVHAVDVAAGDCDAKRRRRRPRLRWTRGEGAVSFGGTVAR